MTGGTGASTVGSAFADLVLADRGWVDAEFEAIVSANFGTTSRPVRRSPSRRHPRPAVTDASSPRHGTVPTRPEPRERSPPPHFG